MDRDERERTNDALREMIERSDSGAPAVGSKVRDRFSTDEIYQRVVVYGDYELTAGRRELFFSGLAGGFAIAITFLLYVSLYGAFDGRPVVSQLLYPLGFVYIILGGYQLYTENTLPPVALVLERLASLPLLLAVFLVVLAGNALGAILGAILFSTTGVVSGDAAQAGIFLGEQALELSVIDLFFKALVAGFLVAGVVWMDFAADSTVARLILIYLTFLSIPVAGLYHVVVSFTELIFFVLETSGSLVELGRQLGDGLLTFILPVLLGNTLGGILLVTVVNYYQTTARRLEAIRNPKSEDPLTLSETLFGGFVGRDYVPPAEITQVEQERNAATEAES